MLIGPTLAAEKSESRFAFLARPPQKDAIRRSAAVFGGSVVVARLQAMAAVSIAAPI